MVFMKNLLRILSALCLVLIPAVTHAQSSTKNNSETEATIVMPRALGNSAPQVLTWSPAEERRRQITRVNQRLAEVFGNQPIAAPIDSPDANQ
jgi:hypothetical protein